MNAYDVHVQMNYQSKHFVVLLNTTDILFRLRCTPAVEDGRVLTTRATDTAMVPLGPRP